MMVYQYTHTDDIFPIDKSFLVRAISVYTTQNGGLQNVYIYAIRNTCILPSSEYLP